MSGATGAIRRGGEGSWVAEPFFTGSHTVRITSKETLPLFPGGLMQANETHPISENELYLKLFITNGGGW